jgi:pyruvate dehydrogenase E2 component (dihydrolipoamide acetyltransferase)
MADLILPELGENIEEADVAAVLVAVGDVVQPDQPVVEVETEKASLEVPATERGKVVELLVKQGDKVHVGQALLRLDAEVDAAEAGGDAERDKGGEQAETQEAGKEERQGREEEEEPRETRETEDEARVDDEPRPEEREAGTDQGGGTVPFPARGKPSIGDVAPAAPSTRALANQLGVDVNAVRGTGPGGRISREDVKAHAKRIIRGAGSSASTARDVPQLPDFSQWGEVEREPLTAVRRATAAAMGNAWAVVPHVTQFDRAEITQLEATRQSYNARPEAEGRKLTVTAIAIKVAAAALRRFARFNASLDVAGDALVLKKYVHLGVAVDTDRGLLVPVIRDADRKGLLEIVDELGDLAERARRKKIAPDEMRGACFTVSNLGGLGTTYFSPIVNWPEVAILGVGRAEQHAVFEGGPARPGLILPLSLSYDHRVVDGADAARFLRWVAERLEQPLLLLLED